MVRTDIEQWLASSWTRLSKRPWVAGLGAAILSAGISLFMPNYYRSEVRILPADSKGSGGLGQLASAAASLGIGIPGQDGGDANFVDIVNSRWLRESLLKTEFRFKIRTWRFGEEREVIQTLYAYTEAGNLDQAVQKLGGILSASRDLKSKVLVLSAETKSPSLSQAVVQRASALLETFARERGQTRGGFKAAFASARLKEARQELGEAEEDLRRFLDSNRNYLSSTDPAVRLQGMKLEAELKLRQQLVVTLAINREQAILEEKNDVPILNLLDAGNLPIEKSRPARSTLVLMTFVLSFGVTWGWRERRWLQEKLSGESQGEPSPRTEEA